MSSSILSIKPTPAEIAAYEVWRASAGLGTDLDRGANAPIFFFVAGLRQGSRVDTKT